MQGSRVPNRLVYVYNATISDEALTMFLQCWKQFWKECPFLLHLQEEFVKSEFFYKRATNLKSGFENWKKIAILISPEVSSLQISF